MRLGGDTTNSKGFIAYAAIILWFLLVILAPLSANAEPVALRAADILPSIEAALMEKGVPANAEIALSEPNAPIVLANKTPDFDSVSVNPVSGRFLIRVRGMDGSPGAAIAGVAKIPALLPALIAPVARGDVIAEDNIDWIKTSEARPADYISSLDALVGMEARRTLQAGQALRPNDVIAPVLVKKGALVTMTYVASGLALSHAGVAQAAGAKGDVIDVKNVKSERIVKAVIIGANRLAVASPRLAASGME
ncbi:MAG: flagellar basal body P-ring formation chaperone FlgA [Amphiplicatus sp.]